MPDQPASTRPEALPPAARILEMTYSSFVVARALYAFAQLGLPDLMRHEPAGSDELAATAGAHPRSVYRLLRTLSVAGIVSEAPDGRFVLTALGRTLRRDEPGSMRGWVVFSGEPCVLQAWEQIVHSIRTGKPAWEHVHGMPVFEYLARHPETARIFDEAMTSLSAGEVDAIVGAYDFSGIRTLADVGGGQGLLLRTILRAHPQLRGILFDLPHVVDGARAQLASEGLAERCDVVPGDVFQAVPAGAEAYVLKYVIHDWDDERSVAILKNCRRAMPANGTLLLIETVVPAPGEPHYAKLQDLEMLVVAGAQERTVDEYARLLEQADFRLVRVVPTSEPVSIIEAVPR